VHGYSLRGILRRNNGDWVRARPGAVRAQQDEWSTMKMQSRGPRRVGMEPLGAHQSGMKQRVVYTVKSNRQPGQDAGSRAIGGGRGWACAGVRTIGGDALAMQVHAGHEHTYRL